jgi:photosystem II stability/assembly factor-like uncharacterized protein
MKTLNLFTFLFLLIFSVNLRGQWETLNEGGDDFRTIDFVNNNIGWIAGSETLLETDDGGLTWNFLTTDSVWNIDQIDFVDDSTGWAISIDPGISDPKYIIKTTNGGHTWSVRKEINMNNEWYKSILFAVNDSLVYVAGYEVSLDLVEILKTEDGGLTWTDISPINSNMIIYSIWFQDDQTGIVLGKIGSYSTIWEGIILRTYTGGNAWDQEIQPDFTAYDIQFLNDSIAYFLAWKDSVENRFCCYCETTDMCSSWTIKTQSAFPIHSFYCLDTQTVFMLIESTCIMKSMNGGLSWDRIQDTWAGEKIYFSPANIGFVLGGSFLSISVDNGQNWNLHKFSWPLNEVYFINQNNGIVCGTARENPFAHGWIYWSLLFFTYNGGETWKHEYFTDRAITSCYFLNDYVGFISAQDLIFKTTDSGDIWTEVYSDSHDSTFSFSGNDLCFINEMNGWTVGRYEVGDGDTTGSAILGTDDGGENWDLVWTYPDSEDYAFELHSIHAMGTTAWAVGECGQLVKYTPPDQWQAISSITDLPLRKVFFSDENHGWIAGGYFNHDNVYLKLFRTTDAGASWQEIPDFHYLINDLFFENSTHGWAVGQDTSYQGIILETSDGGQNWMVQRDCLSAPLNALHFTENCGWAVGEKGLVLRTDDGVSWVDQNSGRTYPNAFKLFQNYPNPFNPTTTIEFELPRASKVTLKIYNILGEEVATLLSGSLNSGSHSIEWSRPAGIASGIYFYRLQARDPSQSAGQSYVKTRKMVVMR